MEGAEGSDGQRSSLDREDGRQLLRGEPAGAVLAGESDNPTEEFGVSTYEYVSCGCTYCADI